MPSITEITAEAILDRLPARLFVALETADGSEPSGGGYARVEASRKDFAVEGATLKNLARFTFPIATGSWGAIRRVCLYDEDGAELFSVDLVGGKDIGRDDEPYLPPGMIRLSVVETLRGRASA